MYVNGFRGQVYSTSATAQLCEIMLRDSAHIQMFEAEWRNRKGRREGKPEFIPAYTMEDAMGVLRNFVRCPYDKIIKPAEGIEVRFVDAGHLLGSSSIEVWMTEEDKTEKIVFSGDIGNIDQPLIRDPEYIKEADYVLMESTYGSRFHDTTVNHLQDLVNITQRTLDRGGNVVMPAFAVGRTQELLYLFRQIKQEHLIAGHDNFPVYVDSPLAVDATHVFSQNLDECYDDETRAIVDKGINPISFRGLNLAITLEESKAINFDETPKVIISASGMCDAGRIRHHIKYNLWRPESTIVFAGYQAEGTLGRALMDGADHVKLFGEEVAVKAEIAQMADMSSHADQFGLMNWIRAYEQAPDRVFLVHGNDDGMEVLSKLIEDELHYTVNCPYSGSVFDLLKNEWETVAEPKKIEKPTYALVEDGSKRKKTSDAAYDRLLAAYTKLSAAVKANYGGANKDLARFTNQLLSLYDKWIR